MKIGLIADTHSFLDSHLLELFKDRDEIWHGGDFGSQEVINSLLDFKPLKGVYGNIDSPSIRHQFPLNLRWVCEGMNIFMSHIAGYPGKYNPRISKELISGPCDLFICGHSHILKIMKDPLKGHLHINPGACGHEGFHSMRTAVRFEIIDGQIKNMDIIELGLRGKI